MARRRFSRTRPDMGWYVGTFNDTFAATAAAKTSMYELIAFPEIDGDEGIIAKDKSDWFIKRIVFDAFFSFDPAAGEDNSDNSVRRIFDWALCTMSAPSAADAESNDWPVAEPDFLDATRRMLRSGTSPVYMPRHALVEMAAAVNGQQITEDTGSATVPKAMETAPWFGDARITFDIDVSNAGLVPDSSLYFAVGAGPQVAPTPRDAWVQFDVMDWRLTLKVLLQKRRA